MARDTKKKSTAAQNDQLSVPAAATQVVKAIAQVRSVQPDASSGHDGAAAAETAVPQRTRAELKADIETRRGELEDVLGELGGRLDVGHRVRTAVDEIKADPVTGAKKHPKTVIAAAAVTAGAVTGIVVIIRAIAR